MTTMMLPLLLTLMLTSAWARDLHEARVSLVEKNFLKRDHNEGDIVDRDHNEGDIVDRSLEERTLFPNYLPVEVQRDGVRVASLMLQRSADLDQGFPMFSADGDFDTIPAHRLTDAAMYQDTRNHAAFGVKRDENGNREYEGSFVLDGQTYSMNREEGSKRSDGEYTLTRSERKPFGDDVIRVGEKMERTNPKFNKRASPYKVEIGVLVDYSEYNFWFQREGTQQKALSLVYYKMTYVLNQLRMSYQSVSGISITPYFTKVSVNTNARNSIIDNSVPYWGSADFLLNKWGQQAGQFGMAAGSDVDMGMWWAKYDICSSDSCGTIGLAWMSGVCDPTWGYVIIEDTTSFTESAQTASHEIAHNLGSEHDGDGNSCNGDDHYVMSPSSGWPPAGSSHTGYDFSPCSIQSMTKTLSQKSCLADGAQDNFPKVNAGLPGAVFSVNAQCEMTYGSTSSECSWKEANDERCRTGLWCTDPSQPGYCKYSNQPPWEGTPCGNGRYCDGATCRS